MEIAASEIVSVGSKIHIIGPNGPSYQVEWQSLPLNDADSLQCAIGDVNGDNVIELVVFLEGGANNVQIYKYYDDGQTYNMLWQSCDINPTEGLIGDVNGDNTNEIVVGSRSWCVIHF